ncbi:hypothetical protein AMC83_PA00071 (plasmid) [Rhizobium phaseoli]|uniref:hypothetical protein n=1 Tax=Rhizobium phaseoli TaxID=396 RepID=UPI0007EBFF0F|nr:hypothetical protein [Rhizobium phaseoli]ANL74298.1 hypothetical protein AMC83_PA00071 [Rhizobium phaseoli]
MNITELSWKDRGGGRYLLSVTTPAAMEQARADQIARVIHDHGFSSQGRGQWLSPEDPNAPADLWAELTEIEVALGMDAAVLPPSLLIVVADLQFA